MLKLSPLYLQGHSYTLYRFTSRRGFPSTIFSDNATNFKGAQRELKALFETISSAQFQTALQDNTSLLGIKCNFSPSPVLLTLGVYGKQPSKPLTDI